MQRPFRSVVCQANPAISEEPGEDGPALYLEHVVDRPDDRIVLRQPIAFGAQPALKPLDQRLGQLGPDRLTAPQRRDLMEIVEERYGRRSTVMRNARKLVMPGGAAYHGGVQMFHPG